MHGARLFYCLVVASLVLVGALTHSPSEVVSNNGSNNKEKERGGLLQLMMRVSWLRRGGLHRQQPATSHLQCMYGKGGVS